MRRAAKVDESHNEVVRALRKAGVFVFDTSAVGRGFPDLVCSYAGFTVLVEVKSPKGTVRDSQREFRSRFPGSLILVRSGEEAVREFFKARSVDFMAHDWPRREVVNVGLRGRKTGLDED